MNLIESIHSSQVASRRVQILSMHLAKLVPKNVTVLDVGCGDGQLAASLTTLRPDVTVKGVDVLVRDQSAIPVDKFDGLNLPFGDNSFDVVTFVDVLHHADDASALVGEATRVARQSIVIKDHLLEGIAARPTLRFMDWVGNHRYGVALPYNYLNGDQWQSIWDRWDLTVEKHIDRLSLYPWPASLVFDRHLHFAARLGVPAAAHPLREVSAATVVAGAN